MKIELTIWQIVVAEMNKERMIALRGDLNRLAKGYFSYGSSTIIFLA